MEENTPLQKGNMYLNKNDYPEALKWFLIASKNQNCSESQYKIGNLYYWGHGVVQSYKEAMRWYLLSANQNNSRAQNNVGKLYQHGQGIGQDIDEAINWYLLSAKQNNSTAQYNLGDVYYKEKYDFKEAFKWFRLSAENGHCYAQFYLGIMYHYGDGVDVDFDEAMKWYILSAKLNMPQYRLGDIHFNRGAELAEKFIDKLLNDMKILITPYFEC